MNDHTQRRAQALEQLEKERAAIQEKVNAAMAAQDEHARIELRCKAFAVHYWTRMRLPFNAEQWADYFRVGGEWRKCE